jgi:hypothetical protein
MERRQQSLARENQSLCKAINLSNIKYAELEKKHREIEFNHNNLIKEHRDLYKDTRGKLKQELRVCQAKFADLKGRHRELLKVSKQLHSKQSITKQNRNKPSQELPGHHTVQPKPLAIEAESVPIFKDDTSEIDNTSEIDKNLTADQDPRR